MAKRKPVTEGTVAVTMQRAADVFGRRGLMLAELAAYCSLRSSDEAGVGNQVAADEWAVLAYQCAETPEAARAACEAWVNAERLRVAGGDR